MRVETIAAFCFSAFVSAAWSQPQVSVGSEPSPMESFASRPRAHTLWSTEAGHLEHDGTRVVLTAITLEDRAQPAVKVRGVKVDLSKGDKHDQIYLDEEAAARTRSALEGIAAAVAGTRNPGNGSCQGAKEFWPLYDWPWNKYHELNIDFCGEPNGAALVLYGRGKAEPFRFPGENPARLAGILAAAMDQLKEH